MKHWILALVAALALGSCTKKEKEESICFDGIVRYAGDPAADGLGWVVQRTDVRSRPLVPRNLPDNFKVENLPVSVCLYETGEKANCFCAGNPPNYYYITNISRR
jgi:hypothetical protein